MKSSTSSSSYTLEITINSVEALTIGKNKHVTKNIFVTISTDIQGYSSKLQTNLCSNDNVANATWKNEEFVTTIPMMAKFIILEVYYKKRSSDKLIGIAKIPTSEYIGNNLPSDYLHCLSYRLREQNGEPNGIINFSMKAKGMLDSRYHENQCNREAIEIQGFSYRENHHGPKPYIATPSLVGRRKSTAAVVGVPAAWYDSCQA